MHNPQSFLIKKSIMKKNFTLFILLFFAVVAQSQTTYFKALLDGTQEVPANSSTANGVVIIKYNGITKILQLTGDYQNVASGVTVSHVHSPAAPGSNAGALFDITNSGGTTGTLKASATLTVAQEADLIAGNMYVNVHSSTFAGGEIRGQITGTTAGQTDYLTGRVQGAQEAPPNGSLATGSVTTLLDKFTGMVYVTGSFTGLTAIASAAHIHRANPTINGPVIIPLQITADTKGTIHEASSIAPSDRISMSAGGTYVNIHNANFPGGEIRGQLIMESQMVYLKAVLQGSQEVPTNTSTALGTVIVRYNTVTNSLELGGNYQNLTTDITMSHIHGPAAVGVNAGVVSPVINSFGTSGILALAITLTEPQEADLLAGLLYVNLHNATFPGGEIRGQLTTTTSGSETYYFTGALTGSQEVPAIASTATGNVAVLLDRITNEVFVVGNFSGLAAAAAAGHIHGGAAGTNGGVVVDLSVTAALSGTITGSAVVRSTFADSMVLGLSYVNVHNATFPGGEIRAQLGNLVLPVKLTYFNGFKQNNKVILNWESTEELNLKQYSIEQQYKQVGNWITKAIVSPKGGSTVTKYSQLEVPFIDGSNYAIYRLKMTDIDGKIAYSPILRIKLDKSSVALTVQTNPLINNQLKFLMSGLPVNKRAVVSIIDFSGRVVLKTTAFSLVNNNIDVTNLTAGIYKLVVQVDDVVLQQSFTK